MIDCGNVYRGTPLLNCFSLGIIVGDNCEISRGKCNVCEFRWIFSGGRVSVFSIKV